jgi:hypothetical protein
MGAIGGAVQFVQKVQIVPIMLERLEPFELRIA